MGHVSLKHQAALRDVEASFERVAAAPLERAGAADEFHDYVLSRYEPLASPEGKLRSLNLLVESFALAGVEAKGLVLMNRLRAEYGPYRTVWGIKWHRDTQALAWELYFYDFDRVHADCTLPRIVELCAPSLQVEAEEPQPLPWHMISIEFGREHLLGGPPVPAHLYIDMRSYELRGRQLLFENVYTFHDPRGAIDEVLHRLRSSVHFDPARDELATLLPPALFRSARVCVANKRGSDGVYASRILTPALLWFMERNAWPAPLTGFVRDAAAELDHLLWCVGGDFRRGALGLELGKTGLYGTF
jgi:hypothetical protein